MSLTQTIKRMARNNAFVGRIARRGQYLVTRATKHPWKPFPRYLPDSSVDYLKQVIDSGFCIDFVEKFEEKFAKMIGTKHAVAVSNCTSAVHTVLASCGLSPGDEVIVSPIADYGDIQGLLSECLVPVFPDVDVKTGNVTAEHIEAVITPRTRAVLLVHFYGLAADIRPIVKLCEQKGLFLVEDCCQSTLARDGDGITGSFGACGTFSLDREKHMSTDGGGMIVTNDNDFAEKCRRFAHNRGAEERRGYGRIHSELGFNYRYSMLQAAVGLAQLETFPARMERRMELASRLANHLEDVPGIAVPPKKQPTSHAYWLFNFLVEPTAFSKSVDEIGSALSAKGVAARRARYYLVPESHTLLHRSSNNQQKAIQPGAKLAMDRYDYSTDLCPQASEHMERSLNWFWSEHMDEEQVDKMAAVIKTTLDQCR